MAKALGPPWPAALKGTTAGVRPSRPSEMVWPWMNPHSW